LISSTTIYDDDKTTNNNDNGGNEDKLKLFKITTTTIKIKKGKKENR